MCIFSTKEMNWPPWVFSGIEHCSGLTEARLSLAGVPKWLCQQEASENNWSRGICSLSLPYQAGQCWDSFPLPSGWHTVCHSSFHSIRLLPWCFLALLTGGLWRYFSQPPSYHLQATRQMLLSPLWAKNKLARGLLLSFGLLMWAWLCTCYIILISMRDLGTCIIPVCLI